MLECISDCDIDIEIYYIEHYIYKWFYSLGTETHAFYKYKFSSTPLSYNMLHDDDIKYVSILMWQFSAIQWVKIPFLASDVEQISSRIKKWQFFSAPFVRLKVEQKSSRMVHSISSSSILQNTFNLAVKVKSEFCQFEGKKSKSCF